LVYFSPALVFCAKKNLAILVKTDTGSVWHKETGGIAFDDPCFNKIKLWVLPWMAA
jgi:hypothetical protein